MTQKDIVNERLAEEAMRDAMTSALKIRIAQIERCGHWPERLEAARRELYRIQNAKP